MPLFKKNASTSHGDQALTVEGRRAPKLKLGRNFATPGLLTNNLVPPAGKLVQATAAEQRGELATQSRRKGR